MATELRSECDWALLEIIKRLIDDQKSYRYHVRQKKFRTTRPSKKKQMNAKFDNVIEFIDVICSLNQKSFSKQGTKIDLLLKRHVDIY